MATSCGSHSYFEPLLNLATNSGFTPVIITCDEIRAVLACLNPFATKTQHYISHVSPPNLSVPHTALAPLIAPRGFKWPSVTEMDVGVATLPQKVQFARIKHHLSGECGFYSSPSPEKKGWWTIALHRYGAVHKFGTWFFVACFFFFWHLIILTTWTNSWPTSSAFTCCNFECMSSNQSEVVFASWHHPHIPPIQSSKDIRRIIPKSWFCSTSLWIRQYVQVPNIPWYAFCALGRIFTWLMIRLHAHFMPHLQNCFLSVFVFILKKHLFKGQIFSKVPFF